MAKACYPSESSSDQVQGLLGDDGLAWYFNQTISAKLTCIASLSEDVQKFCISRTNANLAVSFLGQDMNLVLSELLTNIVNYAYPSSNDGKIEVHVRFINDFLEVLIIDQGTELPGHVLEKKNIEFNGEEIFDLPEGGFGWSIVHSIIDEVVYQRINKSNRLLLRKNII